MADKFPQTDWKKGRVVGLLADDGLVADLADAEFLTTPEPPPAEALYIGASGQSTVYLAARPVSQTYLGARRLFA